MMNIDQGRPFEPEARAGLQDLIDVTEQCLGSRDMDRGPDVCAFLFE